MISLFERATVNDFDAWHEVFIDFAPTLQAKGVVASSVYRSVEDPNDVTVIHEFSTLAEAKAFMDSSELKAARKRADVTTSPTFWYTTKM